jgi:hypothetical protein
MASPGLGRVSPWNMLPCRKVMRGRRWAYCCAHSTFPRSTCREKVGAYCQSRRVGMQWGGGHWPAPS